LRTALKRFGLVFGSGGTGVDEERRLDAASAHGLKQRIALARSLDTAHV